MIYQLAKTSPYLSGQVRLDMCVSNTNSNPIIDDIHIVPLSDNIIFNESNSRETYNYTHEENVKNLYNQIEEVFYVNIKEHNSDYILYNKGQTIDPFDHSYEMGLKRMRYQRYNRQFAFLCPLWVSEVIDYAKLEFIFTLEDANPSGVLTSIYSKKNVQKVIKLSKRTQQYFHDYMNVASRGANPVSNDLIGFKLDPVNAHITGLQVNRAKVSTLDISNIIQNMVSRERPVMEFDNLILSQFRMNRMVARQLLNLNIVFNFSDVFGEYVDHTILGHDVNIKCQVRYDNNIIDIKDLYTNYTNIPIYDIDIDDYSNKNNVLEYLQDYKSIELVQVNKTTQPIFHWALVDNPEYIYNLYDGFSPCFMENNELRRIRGYHYDQGDLGCLEDNKMTNTIKWCRHYDLSPTDLSVEVEMNTEYTNPKVRENIVWLGNNKFDLTGKLPITYDDISIDINKIGINTVKYITSNQVPSSAKPLGDSDDGVYMLYIARDDVKNITIMANNNDYLTLHSLSDRARTHLQAYDSHNPPIYNTIAELLTTLYKSWIKPYKIIIRNSIIPSNVYIDNKVSDVVEYFKNDSAYIYLYRYTGDLMPAFVDIEDPIRFNVSFYYKQWDSLTKIGIPDYNRLIKLGYIPNYPKLFKGGNNNDNSHINSNVTQVDNIESFYKFKECKFTKNHNEWYDDWKGDRTWLNDNKIWNLPTNIIMNITIPENSTPLSDLHPKDIEKIFRKKLYERISTLIPRLSDGAGEAWCYNWINSKYEMKIDSSEYASLTDIEHITYRVKFNLI